MTKRGRESEAKYRLRSGQRRRIEAELAGFERRRLRQVDQYYDVGDRVLRLRREDGRWLLTYKDRPKISAGGVKVRGEVEVPVPEAFAPDLEALILWLGHRRLTKVKKTRDVYHVDGLTVSLDRVEGLAEEYAEVEVLGNRPDALARLAELRDRLRLSDDQVELRSYARLVAEREGRARTGPD
jgi:predicted adenylyl cyclase CyaB